MQKIQDRVLAKIEEIAGEPGHSLDAAINFNRANAGEVVFYEDGTLRPAGRLTFSFQRGYVMLNPGRELRTDQMLEYASPSFERCLRNAVERAIAGALQ